MLTVGATLMAYDDLHRQDFGGAYLTLLAGVGLSVILVLAGKLMGWLENRP